MISALIFIVLVICAIFAILYGLQQLLRYLHRRELSRDIRVRMVRGEMTPSIVLRLVAGNSPDYGTPVDYISSLQQDDDDE
jgi:uncharacterized membrane protein